MHLYLKNLMVSYELCLISTLISHISGISLSANGPSRALGNKALEPARVSHEPITDSCTSKFKTYYSVLRRKPCFFKGLL